MATIFVPTYGHGNCSKVFSEVATKAQAFFESTQAASKGDTSFSELLELAALLSEEVHHVGFQKEHSGGYGTVGEVVRPDLESVSAFVYFNPNFSDAPKVVSSETTELRKLVARVEIPEAILKVIKFIAHELAGIKPDGNGVPHLSATAAKKRDFIAKEISTEFLRLSLNISNQSELGDRRIAFERLLYLLSTIDEGQSDFQEARAKYSIENGMGVYEEIYDKLARELITEFPELPKEYRKKLLKLTINPEAELIEKTEAFAQNHPQSLFEEKWTLLTPETFTNEEIHFGKARGVFFQNKGRLGKEVRATPVTLLKAIPESDSWLVAPTSHLSSKFRNQVEIYRVSSKDLGVSNFPDGATQIQFELSEKEPNAKFKYTPILVASGKDRESKEARLSFVLKSLGVTPPVLDEKPAELSEPIIVSRYPDSRTLESAESVLKASIAREFLLTEGGRELSATTADLKVLEKFFTLNGPESPAEGEAPTDLSQIESIKQSKTQFRNQIEALDSEIKAIREEYGISDIPSLIKLTNSTPERHELFDKLGTKLLGIEERLDVLPETSKEKVVLGAVHSNLKGELFKFAGPKNKDKANKWLEAEKTERKNTPTSLRALIRDLSPMDRKFAAKHLNPKSFDLIPIIKPGETVKFLMGSPWNEAGRRNDEDQKEVVLTRPFLMQATDVTQAQWAGLMGTNPSYFKEPATTIKLNGIEIDPNRPVETVSWWSAVFYCNERSMKEGLEPVYDFSKVKFTGDAKEGNLDGEMGMNINRKANGYRLPTEAEWEYAIRGGTTSAFSFGDNKAGLYQHGYYLANSGGKTQPVAQLKANNLGLYDMHGNVNKWIEDFYSSTPPRGTDPTSRIPGFYTVLRGGSWGNIDPLEFRSAYRSYNWPSYRSYHVGFRVVRTP